MVAPNPDAGAECWSAEARMSEKDTEMLRQAVRLASLAARLLWAVLILVAAIILSTAVRDCARTCECPTPAEKP